jgi:LPXTG-site transpeptidase (sortase) family protein
MEEEKHHFQIHIDPESNKSFEKKEPEHKVNVPKRTVKTVLKDAGRQLLASLVILVIGFLAFNWSAYYQIGQSKFYQIMGIERETPLTRLISEDNIIQERAVLAISSDPEAQKRQIPSLDLEVVPVDNRIIVPSINQNIPIVNVSSESLKRRDWAALERDMQEALKDGVVHYPGTSVPGQTGNVVITGHSSYFPWDSGRFKDVFALLHDVNIGDRIVIYYNQDKYVYEINDSKVVRPEDIEVLKQVPGEQLTLITCTPIGTNLRRLVVTAKPIAKNGIPVNGDRITR